MSRLLSYSCALGLIALLGCGNAPQLPATSARSEALNLLVTGQPIAIQTVLPMLSDSLQLQLGKAAVDGLDAATLAWSRLHDEAGLVQGRFGIAQTMALGDSIVDIGTVILTDRQPKSQAVHDSTFAFRASWHITKRDWKLRYLSITEIPQLP